MVETSTPIAERYYVDPNWYERNRRSFGKVVQSRMCPSCQAKVGKMVEEHYTTVDPKTNRVVTRQRKVPFGSNPLRDIRDCCARAADYIQPGLPLMEIIFRVFLAKANQPMTVDDLRQELLARASHSQRVRFLTPETLKRMLDRDHNYGIRLVETPGIEG